MKKEQIVKTINHIISDMGDECNDTKDRLVNLVSEIKESERKSVIWEILNSNGKDTK
jgi:hypothetical protein